MNCELSRDDLSSAFCNVRAPSVGVEVLNESHRQASFNRRKAQTKKKKSLKNSLKRRSRQGKAAENHKFSSSRRTIVDAVDEVFSPPTNRFQLNE